jgi:hypothetical protein
VSSLVLTSFPFLYLHVFLAVCSFLLKTSLLSYLYRKRPYLFIFLMFHPLLSISLFSASCSEISSARSLTAKVYFCYFIIASCYATAFGGVNAPTKCAYKHFFQRCNLPSLLIWVCITSTITSYRLSPASHRFASPNSSSVLLAS